MIETFIDFFKRDESKRYLKETIIYPVGNIIYNEIYIYLWMICVYHVFLIFIVLVNLYLLLRIIPYLHNFSTIQI